MTEEFPPYPEGWIILKEYTTDDEDPVERYLYRIVDFAEISGDTVHIGQASYWIYPERVHKEWYVYNDCGSSMKVSDLKKILSHV